MAMQYRVPQNIFMPDKIIGPLTLAQFLYLASAAGIDVLIWFATGTKNLVAFFFLAIPIAAVGAALAFIKINGLPFNKIIQAYLSYSRRAKKRIFMRFPELERPVVAAPKIEKKLVAPLRPGQVEIRSKIHDLSTVLDTLGWSEIKQRRPEVSQIETETAAGSAKPVVPPVGQTPMGPPTQTTAAFAALPEEEQQTIAEQIIPPEPGTPPPPEATPPGEPPMPY